MLCIDYAVVRIRKQIRESKQRIHCVCKSHFLPHELYPRVCTVQHYHKAKPADRISNLFVFRKFVAEFARYLLRRLNEAEIAQLRSWIEANFREQNKQPTLARSCVGVNWQDERTWPVRNANSKKFASLIAVSTAKQAYLRVNAAFSRHARLFPFVALRSQHQNQTN